MYKQVPTSLNFVDREKAVEKFWEDNNIFKKSMEHRKEGETYTFYDGPPTANGKPHIGHILTRVIKDIIPRYHVMKGEHCLRKAGWDTHGLPVELEVEKLLGIDGKNILVVGDGRAETLKIELMELRGGKPAGTGVYETMNVSAVISAVGQEIELNGISVDTGAKGTVTVSLPSFQTSEADVFAGGDVVTGPKFAIDAIAAGKEGAISIHRYVHPGQSQVIGRDHRDYKAMNPATAGVAIDGFDTAPRQKASGGSAKDAEKTFRDLRGTLTEEQLKTETRRCLDCGTAVVDESLCVGCGICTTKCKFDAIRLEKVTDFAGTPYFKALLGAAGNAPAALAKLVVKKVARP